MASPFPQKIHDHRGCIENAFRDAEQLCAERGVRLTAQRRRVLAIVWREHKPVGAYQILEALRNEDEKSSHRAEPPTVYRALDFLIRNGLVHRIESLNAYVGCCYPGKQHDGVFLICQSCGTAGEVPSHVVNDAVSKVAYQSGFSLTSVSLEAVGECPDCSDNGGKGP